MELENQNYPSPEWIADDGEVAYKQGFRLSQIMEDVVTAANYLDRRLFFHFGHYRQHLILVKVGTHDNALLLLRDWLRAFEGWLGEKPVVGPHPHPVLLREEWENDMRLYQEGQARRWRYLQ